MLDPLAFKAVSYGLILYLALVTLLLCLLSLKKEYGSGKSLEELFLLILVIAGLCGVIAALAAFVDIQRPVSVLLKWERAAITSKE